MSKIIIISLIITAIHVCTWEGMIFYRIAEAFGCLLDRMHLSVLRKPAFECLICMGGIWTIIIYPILYGWSWDIIPTMLCVIGTNTIISAAICGMQE